MRVKDKFEEAMDATGRNPIAAALLVLAGEVGKTQMPGPDPIPSPAPALTRVEHVRVLVEHLKADLAPFDIHLSAVVVDDNARDGLMRSAGRLPGKGRGIDMLCLGDVRVMSWEEINASQAHPVEIAETMGYLYDMVLKYAPNMTAQDRSDMSLHLATARRVGAVK